MVRRQFSAAPRLAQVKTWVAGIVILIYSFVAGIVTGVGALIAILVKNLSNRVVSLSLGFASGIMIGISALSWPDAGNSYGFTHSLSYYFL